MTADRTPIPPAVFDRSRPLEERRRLYAAWAESHGTVWHTHPGQPAHGHPGGNVGHEHKEAKP